MLYYVCKKGKVTHMEKLTKRDYITRILSYARDEDKAFLEHELELLDRKNAKRSTKPTAKQLADVTLMEDIHASMEPDKRYTVTDMLGELEPCAGLSSQKLTALLTKMRNGLMVAREVTKGKAYFVRL